MKNLLTRLSVFAVLLMVTASAYSQTYTIGADNGTNTTTSYPSPFGDWYKTQRMQFLYLASELTAAGMTAGDITEIGWNVVSVDPTVNATEGYSLKIMSTGTSSLGLTTWEEGAAVVWGPTDYTPTVGVNSFTLASPFSWDGTSNILIEICGGSSLGTYTYNGLATWTGPLAFNGSRTYRSDTELSPCSYSGTTYSDYTPGGPDYRPQIMLTVDAAITCTGAPEVGSATATMETVCPSDVFMVSVTPIAEGSITYQWASSTDGIGWSDIIGATSATHSTSQSVPTWYHATVTCTATGESTVSGDVYVGQNEATDCYCQPTYVTGTTDGDFISNVSLGAINNATIGADAPFYTYYNDLSTDLAQGETYTINLTTGSYGSNNGVAAWIDYNADGVFDEVTEKLGEVTGLAAYSVGSIEFTVPDGATIGNTRLRTREAWNTVGILSCMEYGYGETEDYNVNITPSLCVIPAGGYVDGITSTDAVMHWESMDGAAQYRVTLWNTATGMIATRGTNTNIYYCTGNLTPLTTYGFRVKTVCFGAGAISAPSEWVYWTTLGRLGETASTVTMYPNPNNGAFTLQIAGYENNNFQLFVYDAIGKVVYQKTIDITNNNFTENISLDNVSAGMYQVKLLNSEHQLSYPIMIQK